MKNVDERDLLLHEIVSEAYAAEDAGDFVLWVQERLAAWKRKPRGKVKDKAVEVDVEEVVSGCRKCGALCASCADFIGTGVEWP